MTSRDDRPVRVGLLWRGDTGMPPPAPAETRLRRIFDAFAAYGALVEPIIYAEEAADAVRQRASAMDAVLTWVDPIVAGRERTSLDAMLRDLAGAGVFVSAHPDVIDRMGTKEVLYRTRDAAWGTETHLYRTPEELRDGLASGLRAGVARVLKQNRGSSGNGVWKLTMSRDAAIHDDLLIDVQAAQRGASVVQTRLSDFIDERSSYFHSFAGTGCFVDQPYVDRLHEGMVRCYFVQDRVAGFGHQMVTALLPPPSAETGPPDPAPRLYYGPEQPDFRVFRAWVESHWLREFQTILGVDGEAKPVVWDADFLLGPRQADGEDTYLLCEVNVSGVFPIPDETIAPLAQNAIGRAKAARTCRQSR